MQSSQESTIASKTQPMNLMRVDTITLQANHINTYLDKIKQVSIRDLEYTPYLRFLIAREFESLFKIKDTLTDTVNHYDAGAVLIRLNHPEINEEQAIKLSTAISHLLGIPTIDPLSGKYYATFSVKHTETLQPALLRPYEIFKMHTDGAYMKTVPDWIFFMKLKEVGIVGGQSRLLHLADWQDFNYYYNHPVNKRKLKFIANPDTGRSANRHSHDEEKNTVYSSILSLKNNHKSIRFVDRFMQPANLEEAEFIFSLQNSLENSKAILEIDIPAGSILVINNHHWLHGRSSFQINDTLDRKLMRQRGLFSTHD